MELFLDNFEALLKENLQLKQELEQEKTTSQNYWKHIVWMRTSEDMKPKAAPCPICGSEHVGLEGSVCSREFFVWCLDCDAMGPPKNSERAAIYAWNKGEGVTRYDDDDEEELDDELWQKLVTTCAEQDLKNDLKAYGIDFPIDEILQKDIVAFLHAKQSGKELLDCEAAEIDGDIRAGLSAGTLTKEQADFLYELFVHSW